MEVEEETQEGVQYDEETYVTDDNELIVPTELAEDQEQYMVAEEMTQQSQDIEKESRFQNLIPVNQNEDRSSFVHGLSAGLGIGCIATFIIMWIAVFFSPILPSTITYESMLSIFIYPLIYLLTVGLIALTAGIVREYYTRRSRL